MSTDTVTAEERIVDSLLRSRHWKYLSTMLVDRRERLYQSHPKNDSEVWMKEGAVQEINNLLRAPSLILEWLRTNKQPPESSDVSDTTSPRPPAFVLPSDDL